MSGIIGGAPLAGMADKLMPSSGSRSPPPAPRQPTRECSGRGSSTSATGRSTARIERTGVRVVVTDTVMRDDDAAERLAAVALGAVS